MVKKGKCKQATISSPERFMPLEVKLRSVPEHEPQMAVTFTLSPKVFKHTPAHQLEIAEGALLAMLFQLGLRATLVAELTTSCNVHFHGVVSSGKVDMKLSRDKLHYALRDLTRNHPIIGHMLDVKVIEDYGGWVKYMCKDIVKTHILTMGRPIICDGHRIFDKETYDEFGPLPF